MHDRPAHRPRSSQPDAYVLARRLGLIVLAFVLLIPVAKRLGRDLGDQVVAAEGVVAAAATTVAPSPVASPPPDPLPVTTTVFVAATVPPTVAATVPPSAARAPSVQAAPKVPSAPKVTSAAKPKQTPTTGKKAAAKKAAAAPKPVGTTAAKRKPAVTAAPKPKPAPAPAPRPARTYTAAEVESIIRQVWPDALEDHALAIAKRESKLIPTSRNWCCYGLFAIYYEAGKRLLNSIGVTNANQLFDPWVNSRAAVAIYQAAGWDPWKL